MRTSKVKNLFIGLFAGALVACGTPDTIVAEQTYFNDHVAGQPHIKISQIISEGKTLNYASAGEKEKIAVVFLHGTPGDWRSSARYMMDEGLLERARIVSFDRPGWGNSAINGKGVEASFFEQAKFLWPLLEKLNTENNGAGVILVGHSLGASIAPRVAMEYPQLVSGLVLLSGSLDPRLGKPRWYNWAANTALVSWFLGDGLKQANDEIMPLKKQLEEMRPRWGELTIPVTVVQGLKDELVHPKNIDFAEQVLESADLELIRLPEAGHFVPWENREEVTSAINGVMGKVERNKQFACKDNFNNEKPVPC